VTALVLEPLAGYREYPGSEMRERSRLFFEEMSRRRTVRDFSSRPVDREVIENCLRAAGTAPPAPISSPGISP